MPAPVKPPAVWLDHFVVAIDDLDRGVATFEAATGVGPALGGEHPGLGTHNALVSLGPGCYLEILAPRPGAALAPMVQGVETCTELTPFLWALATDDVAAVHRAVTAAGFGADEPTSGSRQTRDGRTVSWSMFLMQPGSPTNAPFFLEWDGAAQHPSAASPGGCTLVSYTVASDDHVELRRLLESVGSDAPLVSGATHIEIALNTPAGSVTLRS